MAKVTAYQVELANRRAARAALLQKAKAERGKAMQATDKAKRLAHIANAKSYEHQASQLKLRKATRKKKNDDILTRIGKML